MWSLNNDPDMKLFAVDPPPRTPAELAREKRLRDDPMAVVHGPLFVTCKRCGSRIKLSPKSSYDPFHWMKHRERCLRKPVGVARTVRRASKDAYTSPTKTSPVSSRNTDGDNASPPPLTPDDDRPTASKEPSPLLSSNSDDPDLSAGPVHLPVLERWQTWSWSELRPTTWAMDCPHCASPNGVEDDVEVYNDDRDDFHLDPVDMRYLSPHLAPHLDIQNTT